MTGRGACAWPIGPITACRWAGTWPLDRCHKRPSLDGGIAAEIGRFGGSQRVVGRAFGWHRLSRRDRGALEVLLIGGCRIHLQAPAPVVLRQGEGSL